MWSSIARLCGTYDFILKKMAGLKINAECPADEFFKVINQVINFIGVSIFLFYETFVYDCSFYLKFTEMEISRNSSTRRAPMSVLWSLEIIGPYYGHNM